jgi:hypothetical protein
LIATGLGGLRRLALPKWFAIVTVVRGVLNLFGPAGMLVSLLTPYGWSPRESS